MTRKIFGTDASASDKCGTPKMEIVFNSWRQIMKCVYTNIRIDSLRCRKYLNQMFDNFVRSFKFSKSSERYHCVIATSSCILHRQANVLNFNLINYLLTFERLYPGIQDDSSRAERRPTGKTKKIS